MRLVLLSTALVLLMATALLLSGPAQAADTGTVKPTVRVVTSYTGSLSISGDVDGEGVMDFGYLVPGGEAVSRTLNLDVSANAPWDITVTTTQDLRHATSGESIPPENFTFTSTGDAGPTYVTTDTPFRTDAHGVGDQVTLDVATDGPVDGTWQVGVTYKLEIPTDQPEAYYTCGGHVYTLVVGP